MTKESIIFKKGIYPIFGDCTHCAAFPISSIFVCFAKGTLNMSLFVAINSNTIKLRNNKHFHCGHQGFTVITNAKLRFEYCSFEGRMTTDSGPTWARAPTPPLRTDPF